MALHKRLRRAGGWFEWMCEQLIKERGRSGFTQGAFAGRRVLAVDGSDIKEPGATGRSWHLLYAIELPRLRCAHAGFDAFEHGESLMRFPICKGDVVMADRGYAKRGQLAWLINQQADAIVRISPNHFPLECPDKKHGSKPFDWLKSLGRLKGRKSGEWTVRFTHHGHHYQARLCAMRKTTLAQKKAIAAIETEARKKKSKTRPETLEYAKYVMVLTTLPETLLDTAQVLETCRSRWQVELAFKRLKSLLDCRCVPKNDPLTARAWMQGKLLEALLVEKLLFEPECFPPLLTAIANMTNASGACSLRLATPCFASWLPLSRSACFWHMANSSKIPSRKIPPRR
jgi:hypothetical protein